MRPKKKRCLVGVCLSMGLLLCQRTIMAASVPNDPFTWGETTHVANAGWGRMIDLGGHRWLCVSTRFSKPNSLLQIKVSTDSARTWTPVSTLAETGRDVDNGEIIRLTDGTFLLTGRSVISHRTPGAPLSYHLPVYRSTDGGKTWTFLHQIDTSEVAAYRPGQPSLGLWEPHFFLLPHNGIACAYADEKHASEQPAYSQTVAERISWDQGVTWSHEITLAAQPGGGSQRPGMPAVTRMENGQYVAVYEVVGIGDADVYCKTSYDGVNWPTGVGAPIPGQHAGPWITSLKDGRLVVSSCENQISLSDDDAQTWQITSPPAWPIGHVFSWPALYQTATDEIAVMTSYHGVNIRWGRVRAVRPRPDKLSQSPATGRPLIP